MKPILLILTAVLLAVYSVDLAQAAPEEERVNFLADSISRKDDTTITLLGGSTWELSRRTLSLVTDDVLIVFREITLEDRTKAKVTVFYGGGDEIIAKHIGGRVVPEGGVLTSVVKAHGKGAVLELANGRLYSVPQYDRYDTGWWLPPYKALVTGNEMYLWNLKEGKRVWVSPKK
jgi:hypothetical protein